MQSTSVFSSDSANVTRRSVLVAAGALGTATALAGCLGGSGGATTTEASRATTTPSSSGGSTADYDCGSLPAETAAYEGEDPTFSFAFDAPQEPEYEVRAGANATEREARFVRERPDQDVFDYYFRVSETVDTYAETGADGYRNAEAVEPLEFDGQELTVTHARVTDDHELWVLGLPAENGVRVVTVEFSVFPARFGCHDEVRSIAEGIVRSIRPR